MQIIKIYSSLLEPMLAVGKLFGDIDGILKSGRIPNEKAYSHKIQQILNKSKTAINTVRSNWIYSLALHPSAYSIIYPKYLKRDEEIISETKKRTIQFYYAGNEDVVKQICNNKEIMSLFTKDPQMTTNLYDAFISYIQQNPEWYNVHCPAIIRNPTNLLRFKGMANTNVIDYIRSFRDDAPLSFKNPIVFFESLPEELKTTVAEKALIKKIASMVELDPIYYSYQLQDKFKKSPEIIEAVVVGWVNKFTNDPHPLTGFLRYTDIPQEIKNDPRIIKIKNDIVKKDFIKFLQTNFNKVFPEPHPPFSSAEQNKANKLMDELSDDDFVISLYWQEKEKMGKSKKTTTHSNLSGSPIKIKFKQDYECDLVTGVDPLTTESEIFHAGDVADAVVIEDHANNIDIQFDDGSVLNALGKNVFEIIS